MKVYYCLLLLAGGILWAGAAHAGFRTVVLADGTKHKFSYTKNTPDKVNNDWVREVTAAASLSLKRDPQSPKDVSLGWELGFEPLTDDITRVRVYDVTAVEAELIYEEERPEVKKGSQWVKVTPAVSFKDPAMAWACQDKDTVHYFKFVLENSAGETRELIQPSLFSREAKNQIFKLMGTAKLCGQ